MKPDVKSGAADLHKLFNLSSPEATTWIARSQFNKNEKWLIIKARHGEKRI